MISREHLDFSERRSIVVRTSDLDSVSMTLIDCAVLMWRFTLDGVYVVFWASLLRAELGPLFTPRTAFGMSHAQDDSCAVFIVAPRKAAAYSNVVQQAHP